MSIYAPDPRIKKRRDAWLAVLIVSVFSAFCLGAAFALSVEPRLVLERIEPRSFRGTGSNHFAGYQFYTKTVDGITQVVVGSAARDRLGDSLAERQRRASQKHLDLYGADRRRLGWDRMEDQRIIEDFMRGEEPRLALANPPPLWRKNVAWFFAGFGALIFVGAIQSNFFPKAKAPTARS
jgi:hypothetical protein